MLIVLEQSPVFRRLKIKRLSHTVTGFHASRMGKDTILHVVKRVAKKAGVEPSLVDSMTGHSGRRTHSKVCSHDAKLGHDVIQKVTKQKNPAMVGRYAGPDAEANSMSSRVFEQLSQVNALRMKEGLKFLVSFYFCLLMNLFCFFQVVRSWKRVPVKVKRKLDGKLTRLFKIRGKGRIYRHRLMLRIVRFWNL